MIHRKYIEDAQLCLQHQKFKPFPVSEYFQCLRVDYPFDFGVNGKHVAFVRHHQLTAKGMSEEEAWRDLVRATHPEFRQVTLIELSLLKEAVYGMLRLIIDRLD